MGNKNSTQTQNPDYSESSEENPMGHQIDTRRIFSPECIQYPLSKFPSLMKIYQCIEPKKFNFTLLNPSYHGFSGSKIEIYLHDSYMSVTDEKGREEKHDYAHVHSWGIKKGTLKNQLSIKYIDAVDKHQVYVMKGNKKSIDVFLHNILEIINLIVDGYKIKDDTPEPYLDDP